LLHFSLPRIVPRLFLTPSQKPTPKRPPPPLVEVRAFVEIKPQFLRKPLPRSGLFISTILFHQQLPFASSWNSAMVSWKLATW
jgi:hypothetical protein